MSDKKPDNVVFNPETEKYDAALKPYATSVNAPVITTVDTHAWKNRNVNKVNHQIKTQYEELKAQMDALLQEYEYNQLIYSAKFNFEPVTGDTYHLYRDKNDAPFLSVIAPHECNFDFIGSFFLNADQMWKQVEAQPDNSLVNV